MNTIRKITIIISALVSFSSLAIISPQTSGHWYIKNSTKKDLEVITAQINDVGEYTYYLKSGETTEINPAMLREMKVRKAGKILGIKSHFSHEVGPELKGEAEKLTKEGKDVTLNIIEGFGGFDLVFTNVF